NYLGDATAPALLGVHPGIVGLAVALIAVGAFVATGAVEKRVNPVGPASEFPQRAHRLAAAAALGVAAVLASTPDRSTRMSAKASDPAVQSQAKVYAMTPDELAFRVLDRDPSLQLVDVRASEEYLKSGLPDAINVDPSDMLGRGYRRILGRAGKQKVFFAEDEASARQAATLARLLGYENVAVLEGGLEAFRKTILQAPGADHAAVDLAADVARFRERASRELAVLIAERGKPKETVKPVKKVVGGCGV
ncbi:MAG: rhodanese-like domain-containing protein, partial [Planctomycetales bacterium]|nr:rhodanese-like domain-containing protein [Planctomycetales bacterium]